MTYQDFLQRVENGEPFNINLTKKTLLLSGKPYELDEVNKDNAFEKIRKLYKAYKYSLPDKDSSSKYFKALKAEEMTIGDMVYGLERRYAKAMLEAFILGCRGLEWNYKGWFYQDKTDNDLVILKEWF